MKKLFLLSVVSYLVIVFCGTAQAQTTQYDSLTVDSVLTATGTDNYESVEGKPDATQASISTSSGLLGVQFFVNGSLLRLKPGAQLHFYWIKETSDSCGGKITFGHYPDAIDPNPGQASGDTALVMEGGV